MRLDIESILEYIALFLIVSFWPDEVFGGIVTRIILLATIVLLMVIKKKLVFQKNVLIVYLGLLISHIATIAIAGMNFELDVGNLLALTIVFVIISVDGVEIILQKYRNLMFFLSAYSLITYVLYKIVPNVFLSLPTVEGTALTANAFFSLVPIEMDDYYRNFGFREEPGVFAIFLVFALLLETFSDKYDLKRLIVLTIAMITTYSTAGYVSLVLIILLLLYRVFTKKQNDLSKSKKILLVLAIFLGVVVFLYMFFSGLLGNRAYVFKKLLEVGESSGTTYERLRAIQIAYEIFIDSFPFGVGWINYTENFLNNVITTFTPLNWFCIYGFLYGVIMNVGMWLVTRLFSDKIFIRIIAYMSIMSCYISQEFSSTYITIFFVYVGYYVFNIGSQKKLKAQI